MKRPCIVIAGPTAAGKSDIAVKLCHLINGSVISADSMQVYKGLDIGSAKMTECEMQGIPHYLIDVLEPEEEFNVYRFKEMALGCMEKVWSEGRIPVITGGTGFYIQAVVRDVDFSDLSAGPDFRKQCMETAREKGAAYLHEMLRSVDPKAAEQIHQNNLKRVIRALEYYNETGRAISSHNDEQRARTSPYMLGYFVITDDRSVLYDKINARVDKMIDAGLEDEVKALYDRGLTEDNTSMKGIGYREFFAYFEGKADLSETVENIKRDTRHFAKRQITWFKRESDAVWIDRRDHNNDNDAIAGFIAEKWREIQEKEDGSDKQGI